MEEGYAQARKRGHGMHTRLVDLPHLTSPYLTTLPYLTECGALRKPSRVGQAELAGGVRDARKKKEKVLTVQNNSTFVLF